jgi:hypothetical protein
MEQIPSSPAWEESFMRAVHILFLAVSFATSAAHAISRQEAEVFLTRAIETKRAEIEKSAAHPVKVYYRWESSMFQAQGGLVLDKQEVQFWFYGGLLQLPTIAQLAAVYCHEMGHVLGGAPQIKPFNSVEGQADDYVARKCFPELLERGLLVANETSPLFSEAFHYCAAHFESIKERSDCAFTIAETLGSYRAMYKDSTLTSRSIGAETPKETNRSYPSKECRTETILRAATKQTRPRCWFVE